MIQNKKVVTEGLIAHALDFLILPLISIDEYESKIDDKRVIVVGFYVNDEDPAEDLSNFIDKSNLEILDTEVSPAPTRDGHYMVFVEIRRNEEFVAILLDILSEIKNLCNIKNWKMKCPGIVDPILITRESLQDNLILDDREIIEVPDEDEEIKNDINNKQESSKKKDDEIDESVEFWKNAVSDKIELDDKTIKIHKFGTVYEFDILQTMPSGPMNMNEIQQVSALQSLLGPSYSVWSMDNALIVESNNEVWALKSSI